MTDMRRLLGLFTVALIAAVLIAGCPSSETPEVEVPITSTLPETEAEPVVPANIGNAKNADGDYVCPVMGDVVKDFSEDNSVEHEDKVYFFCCSECITKFKADPGKYVAEAQGGEAEEAGDVNAEHSAHPEHEEHAGREHD